MQPTEHRWRIFFIVATGVFIATMDSSMVNIALPAIMAEFKSPLAATQWVALVYLLAITATLLLWGRLADRLGRGRIYPLGFLLFALGSLAAAGAANLAALIGARLLQALGAAMLMATGPALLKESFPVAELGRTLGLAGIAVSLGLMSGPSVGGFLLQFSSWRAIFLVTVPIALGMALFARRHLPAPPAVASPEPFDWPGCLLWIALLTATAFTLSLAGSPATGGATLLAASGGVLLLLALFSQRQGGAAHPFLPPGLLREPYFTAALLCLSGSFVMLFTVLILLPFYLDLILHLPQSRLGLTMMALPLTVLLFAPWAGHLSDRIPARKLATAGLALATVAILLLTRLNATSSPLAVGLQLALLGCGQAIFLAPNSASVLKRVQGEKSAAAAALLATARNLGMLFGIAQASLIFSLSFGRHTGGLDLRDFTPSHSAAFLTALHATFASAVLVGLVLIAVSWWRE